MTNNFLMAARAGIVIACFLLIGGCATTIRNPEGGREVTAPSDFTLSARVSVVFLGRQHAGNLGWVRSEGRDNFSISSPLGPVFAELQQTERGWLLTDAKQRVHQGEDPDELLLRIVGSPLPFQALVRSLLAQSVVDSEWGGWSVSVEEACVGISSQVYYPRRFVLSKYLIRVRVFVESFSIWNIPLSCRSPKN